ncbi:MAG TPA: hypothetical protein VK054_13710 [Beutenbergiaceae bacterium]|nr:hypothetical protein [Beutenbergiaceae bacterium]
MQFFKTAAEALAADITTKLFWIGVFCFVRWQRRRKSGDDDNE